MIFKISFFVIFVCYATLFDFVVIYGETYNSLQSQERYARSNNNKPNNEEFEKFFLKASKSVPRIGRRGYAQSSNMDNDLNGENFQFYRYPFRMPPKRFSKNNLAAPFWTDFAKIYEYNPDLPNVLEYLSNLEQEQNDNEASDTLNMKVKKSKVIPNKELLEYRMQAEI